MDDVLSSRRSSSSHEDNGGGEGGGLRSAADGSSSASFAASKLELKVVEFDALLLIPMLLLMKEAEGRPKCACRPVVVVMHGHDGVCVPVSSHL